MRMNENRNTLLAPRQMMESATRTFFGPRGPYEPDSAGPAHFQEGDFGAGSPRYHSYEGVSVNLCHYAAWMAPERIPTSSTRTWCQFILGSMSERQKVLRPFVTSIAHLHI